MAELKNTIVNGVLNVNGDAIASKIIKRGDAGGILRGNGNVISIGTGTSKFLREDGTWATVSTSDTGATSIEVTGTGNAVTTASYSASTRKITLTKGTTFLTSSDLPPDYVKINISGNSGELTTAQLAALKANPHKTVLNWDGYYCFAENLSSSSTYYYSANCTFNGTTSIDKKVITLNTSNGAWSYSNYTYTNNTYGADRGINLKNGNFGHSNTAITAQSTKGLYKISYDAYGHITGTESFTLPTVNNGTLTIKTTGTGISASGTFTANQQTNSEFSITLNSNSEGNRTVGQVVIAKDTGVIATDKLAISYNTSTKATWQYNASTDCIELIW